MLMYRARQRGEMKLPCPVPVIIRQHKASPGRIMDLRIQPSLKVLPRKAVLNFLCLFFLLSGMCFTPETASFEYL